jgi:hypothetical protein
LIGALADDLLICGRKACDFRASEDRKIDRRIVTVIVQLSLNFYMYELIETTKAKVPCTMVKRTGSAFYFDTRTNAILVTSGYMNIISFIYRIYYKLVVRGVW